MIIFILCFARSSIWLYNLLIYSLISTSLSLALFEIILFFPSSQYIIAKTGDWVSRYANFCSFFVRKFISLRTI